MVEMEQRHLHYLILRGNVPSHAGQGPGLTNRNLGESGGEQSHLLTISEMPSHSHPVSYSINTTDKKK